MTTKYRARAFVFKKIDSGEADKIFSVFTREFGKLEIKARAVRKIVSKLRRDTDVFYFSDIEFIQGKNYKTLTDASVVKKFDTEDLKAFEAQCNIAGILDNFFKGQERDEATFDLIEEVFDRLNNRDKKIINHNLAVQYFFWNFLSLQGYKFNADNCASCHERLNPYSIYFSNKEGGVVCKRCSVNDNNSKKINSDVVKVLRLIFKKDWELISKLKIKTPSENILGIIFKKAELEFCPQNC